MTIDERISAVKAQFAELNEQLVAHMEKRGEIDRQVSGVKEEQIRLQGEFRLLEKMKAEEKTVETEQ